MPETILIIDDEPGITVALRTRLEAAGYVVYHALNGLAGLEAATIHQPSLILLDIRMPDIDGLEVCRRLRQDASLAAIPIIIMSANAPGAARRAAEDAGADRFFPKPFDHHQILQVVRELVSGRIIESH